MRERVYVRIGTTPVMLTATHGADDINTALIAETAAEVLDAHAIINRGFERAETVDTSKDQADCNRIDHLNDPVVYDEFLLPLKKFSDRELVTRWTSSSQRRLDGDIHDPLVLHIHGAGNIVHKKANAKVMAILGYGLGIQKDSITCSGWVKDCFRDHMQFFGEHGCLVCEGGRGSKYAGRNSNNLNQYFRKHLKRSYVDSLQIEIPYSERKTELDAKTIGATIALAVKKIWQHDSSYLSGVSGFFI